VEQRAQKDQGIKTPRSQNSQKREDNDAHKGNGTTENHPKRMTAPYVSFLFFHGNPLINSPMAVDFFSL
jgi:hypothetical protein